MKHTADIIKSFIGSFIVLLVGYINVEYFPIVFNRLNFNVKLNAIGLFISFAFGVFFIIVLFVKRRPLSVINGRIGAMAANLRILKQKPPKNRLKRYIWSTRVSFWPTFENENVRNQFRDYITQNINQGMNVRRIWQLHNREDAKRLLSYLNLYRNRDNYSLKCFIGKNTFIPEILSVYGKVVSVSIPQQEDPRKLTTAFHFRGKSEILRWENYFQILWDQSLSIKQSDTIFEENLLKIKEYFNIGE